MKLVFAVAIVLVFQIALFAQASDSALRGVAEKDRLSRDATGKLVLLSATEHLDRGKIYFDNRLFPQSRNHFYKIIENFPTDPTMSGALFMTGLAKRTGELLILFGWAGRTRSLRSRLVDDGLVRFAWLILQVSSGGRGILGR